ncbi:hypothetical protein KSP39_PZI011703 [Platanthera zijinensis]|uniref:Reverse transcriptase domain-containing protein n=1 Tax=Platanthera zijinensis TaxID=2320716 RepID=A0AAP0G5T1_9ASPA
MDGIISPFQSAFISGRLITYNILLAFELIHHLKMSTRAIDGGYAIKLDMAKACDKVEWSFHAGALRRLGSNAYFISLIIMCVSSSSLSFMLNWEHFGSVQPGRGLRHGNPLSPYSFRALSS